MKTGNVYNISTDDSCIWNLNPGDCIWWPADPDNNVEHFCGIVESTSIENFHYEGRWWEDVLIHLEGGKLLSPHGVVDTITQAIYGTSESWIEKVES